MIQVLLFIFILLLSFPADAAYKVYLRNGSAISGVSSYEKRDGEVIIYFGGGSMGIPEKDILKIEDTEAPEKDFRTPEVPGAQEETPPPAPSGEETGNRTERTNVLRAELESTNSELKAVEEDEARVTKLINDRKGSRLTYNALQLRQLEADMAPLQQELSDLQVKKGGLLQRKASIEGELRSLEQ
jgi:hypothetical protein